MRAAFFLLLLTSLAPHAAAQAVQTVRLAAGPVILIEGEAQKAAPIALTGTLEQDNKASFRIASNCLFEVVAHDASGAALDAKTLNKTGLMLQLIDIGVNAQADGEMIALQSGSGVSLYRSRVRTAARPGQPDSQALTFAAEWTQGAPLIFQVRPILD